MPYFLSISRVIALALPLLCLGCGGESATEVHRVTGHVTYRGRPLPTGTIVFVPDSVRGNNGPMGQAEIQPDGSYTLMSGERYGAAAGWYRVTVAAVEKPFAAPGQPSALPRSLLPDKYRDPELSGLSCEVKPGQSNGINFNLE